MSIFKECQQIKKACNFVHGILLSVSYCKWYKILLNTCISFLTLRDENMRMVDFFYPFKTKTLG